MKLHIAYIVVKEAKNFTQTLRRYFSSSARIILFENGSDLCLVIVLEYRLVPFRYAVFLLRILVLR